MLFRFQQFRSDGRYDINDPINALRVSEWNTNISNLPNLNFSSDWVVKLNSSNLSFSQDIIDLIFHQTNEFAVF